MGEFFTSACSDSSSDNIFNRSDSHKESSSGSNQSYDNNDNDDNHCRDIKIIIIINKIIQIKILKRII